MTFRGKNKVTNEWVYGDLYQNLNQTFIMDHNNHVIEVYRDTVGQSNGVVN